MEGEREQGASTRVFYPNVISINKTIWNPSDHAYLGCAGDSSAHMLFGMANQTRQSYTLASQPIGPKGGESWSGMSPNRHLSIGQELHVEKAFWTFHVYQQSEQSFRFRKQQTPPLSGYAAI